MSKYKVRWYMHPPDGDDMLVLGVYGVRRFYRPRPLRMGEISPRPLALSFGGREI